MLASEVPKPEVKVLETSGNYGKFSIEPLERGYATTLGNPLRRVILGSLEGTAVTWVKIDGILHEYTSIPHVKEGVQDFILNIKDLRLRSLAQRPGKLRLEVEGEKEVRAKDIVASSNFEILNPDLYLATLDSPEARLSVEFNVEQGKGYRPAEHGNGLPIGVLPVDAIFAPVRKVNYVVEHTRLGQVTDYERLILEVWTDGTLNPAEAVRKGAQILVDHFFLLSTTGKVAERDGERPSLALSIPAEVYNMPVEKLELSSRTMNCLKRANLNKVGEVLETPKAELLKIRNFGEKSLQELHNRLGERGFLLPEPEEQPAEETPAAGEEETAVAPSGATGSPEEDAAPAPESEEVEP